MTRLALAALLLLAACAPTTQQVAATGTPATFTTTSTTLLADTEAWWQPVTTTTTTHVHRSRPGRVSRGWGVDSCGGSIDACLDRIAGCESGSGPNSPGSYTAQNPTSTASGRYQFLDGTWAGYGGYARAVHAPPHIQDQAAVDLFLRRGSQPWYPSRHCWGL